MRSRIMFPLTVACTAVLLAACGARVGMAVQNGVGSQPALPAPTKTLIPVIRIAPAVGWPDGVTPVAAPGLAVTAFASGLEHPRWVMVLPNGDVLIAETAAPPKPKDGRGIKGWFMKLAMKHAGSAVPSANRITLLRDADGDGVAEIRTVFVAGLNSPFGMSLIGNQFYVADTDAILRFPYVEGQTSIPQGGIKIMDLPAGLINHHWTKNLIASLDGKSLYVTVGSNSNVGENGIAEEAGRAAIWKLDTASGQSRLFATGLRNPNGLAWEPITGTLWTVANERDELGNDLVPDYLTSVTDGSFYGWPYSYYGQNVDARVQPPRPDLVATAKSPDYALGSHVAALGLSFSRRGVLPAMYEEGAFIGEHGSWNRKPPSGYKVVFIPFANGRPSGPPVDVLSGFLSAAGKAQGRPVGVALDKQGALLVVDDVGNTVWRVTSR